MSFARVSSVLKGLGGSGVTVGAGGLLGYFFYKRALEDIREVVETSKDIMCIPDTYIATDERGNKINGFLEEDDKSFVEEDESSLEAIAKSEKYKKSAAIVLRGSMMLVGLGLSIYVMAEKGAELYQFIESFDPGVAGQQVLSATVTGVTLTLLPAIGVSAGTPAAKIIAVGANKLSYYVNYARPLFKNEKESKKEDGSDVMELAPLNRPKK